MDKLEYAKALAILENRFGCDTLLSLATLDGRNPAVRIVNSFYNKGAFYIITYGLSNKMQQISSHPTVAICGEWFTAHGRGENMGYLLNEKNAELAARLKEVFSEWYSNGHIDESDPNTVILRIRLTDGVLMSNGTRYDLDFCCPEAAIY